MRNPIMPDMPEEVDAESAILRQFQIENPSPGEKALEEIKLGEADQKRNESNAAADEAWKKVPPTDKVIDYRSAFAAGFGLQDGIVPNSAVNYPGGPGLFGHDPKTGERVTHEYPPDIDVMPLAKSHQSVTSQDQKAPHSDIPHLADIAMKLGVDKAAFDRGATDLYTEQQRQIAFDAGQLAASHEQIKVKLERLQGQTVPTAKVPTKTHAETLADPRWAKAARTIMQYKFGDNYTTTDEKLIAEEGRQLIQVFEANAIQAAIDWASAAGAPAEVKQAWADLIEMWEDTQTDWSAGNIGANVGYGLLDPTNLIGFATSGGVIKAGTAAFKAYLRDALTRQGAKALAKEAAVATGKRAVEGGAGGAFAGGVTEAAKAGVSGKPVEAGKVALGAAGGAVVGAGAAVGLPEAFTALGATGKKAIQMALRDGHYGSPRWFAGRRMVDIDEGVDLPELSEEAAATRIMLDEALSPNAPANVIYDSLIRQGVDKTEAEANARVVGTLYDTLADQYGVTHEQLYRAQPYHIRIEDDAAQEAASAALQQAPKAEGVAKPIPKATTRAVGLEAALKTARENRFATNRDLKVKLQENARKGIEAAGLDMNDPVQKRDHVVKALVQDTVAALRENSNAIGWYDEKVSKAIDIVAMLHPEIKTNPEAELAFKWALAVTSNGNRVDKNFELATDTYRRWAETGKMPTDLLAGNTQEQINKGLGLYNQMIEKWGPEELRKFMNTEFTVAQLKRLTGIELTGEAADTVVKGSAILGPKVGNGFFSNLNGDYSRLTMDRWLMRTWGRWTGDLITENPELLATHRTRMGETLAAVPAESRALIEELIGAKLDGPVDEVAQAIQTLSTTVAGRDALNALPGGQDLRKAGNSLAGTLDGQKEAPQNSTERKQIREAFELALKTLRKNGYTDLTMADLQAVIWYPEKRLYDIGKSAEEIAAGYVDDKAPDYANAAAKLAAARGVAPEQIAAILQRPKGAADAGRAGDLRPDAGPAGAGVAGGVEGGAGRGFEPKEKRTFVSRGVIDQIRTNRRADGGSRWSYKRTGEPDAVRSRSIGGEKVDVVGEYAPEIKVKNAFKLAGLAAPKIYETKAPEHFAAQISKLKASSPHASSVYVYKPEEYAQMRTFLTEDGTAGLAIKPDGDIVSGFNLKADSKQIHALMEIAIQEGGRKADAFDTVLPKIYAMHGMKPVARTKWDDRFAPEGWDKATYKEFNGGEPDVVYMVYDPDYRGKGKTAEGKLVNSYEEAVALQGAEKEKLGNVLYQGRGSEVPRGEYSPGQRMARIFNSADASTIPHETSHHFLEMTGQLAAAPDAPRSVRQDFDDAMAWLGTTSDAWRSMTLEERRPFHEKYAQAFEQYLREGRAPTEGLQRIFDSFKEWLTRIYKSAEELGETISPEARAYFDRVMKGKSADVDPNGLFPSLRKYPVREMVGTLQQGPVEKAPKVDPVQAEKTLAGVAANRPDVAPPEKYIKSGTINVERHMPGARADRPPGQMTIDDLAKMENADDVAALLDRIGDEMGFSEEARTMDEVMRANIKDELTPLLSGKQMGLASDKQLFAMRSMVATLGNETVELSKRIAAGDQTAETLLKYQRTGMGLITMQSMLTKNVREVARALAQQRYIAKLFDTQDINALRAGLEDVADPRAIIYNAQALAKKMANNAEKGMTPEQLAAANRKALADAMGKRTFLEAAIEFWTANILSGPTTHAVNIAANTAKATYDIGLMKPLAAAVGSVRTAFSRDADRVYWAEVLPAYTGAMVGLWDGLKAVGHVVKTGESKLGAQPGVGTASQSLKAEGQGAVAGVLSRYMDPQTAINVGRVMTPAFTALKAEDEVFRTLAYRSELSALATRQGLKMGLDGDALTKHVDDAMQSPPLDLHLAALETAKATTFQSSDMGGGLIGFLGNKALDVTRRYPAFKFILPFVSTPANVFRAGLESTVFAGLSKPLREQFMRGGAERDMAIAKVIGGFAMTAAAYGLYQNGMITGDGPSDLEQKKVLESTGWQRNSIRLGDKYISYDRMDPFATPLTIMVSAFEKSRFERRDVDVILSSISALSAGAKHFLDLPFLKGLADIANIAERGPSAVAKWAGRTAHGFVPLSSLVATAARTMDPEAAGWTNQQVGYGASGGAMDLMDEALMQFKSRTPWVRDGLRPPRHWDGEVAMAPRGGILAPFNPLQAMNARKDPASETLVKYGVTVNEPTPILSLEGAGITVNLLDLDSQRGMVYDAYLKDIGEARKTMVTEVIAEPDFRRAAQSNKAEDIALNALELQKAIRDGREEGIAKFMEMTLPKLVKEGALDLSPIAAMLGTNVEALVSQIESGKLKSQRSTGRFVVESRTKKTVQPTGTGAPTL